MIILILYFQNLIGRKGYLPKKIRMSGDTDSVNSASPHYLSEPGNGHSTAVGNLGSAMSPTAHSDIVHNDVGRSTAGSFDLNG